MGSVAGNGVVSATAAVTHRTAKVFELIHRAVLPSIPLHLSSSRKLVGLDGLTMLEVRDVEVSR